ncbi:MAG: hypothetical protein GEU98_20910 [Pseudonocardiaceae bacterium]|nr:hypothetical protein [Pseudonocardiaceae bacterium]
MSRVSKVSPGHIDQARTAADNAATHFATMLKNCENLNIELTGGFGEEGIYHGRLSTFAEQWGLVFEEFIEDERKFATFLAELRDRLQQSHGLYLDTELRNTESFGELSKRLDELGG